MSPELFDPEKFDLKDCRPTKNSDRYAFGMVMYEVLGGQVPFSGFHGYAVAVKVVKGDRPVRPQGVEGRWFTNGIWNILECCWRPNPGDRPKIKDVLHHLEDVSRSWTPRTIADPLPATPPTWDLESSSEENTDEDEVPSASQMVSSQTSQRFRLEGNTTKDTIYPPAYHFSAPYNDALGTAVESLDGSREPEQFPDTVSGVGLFDGTGTNLMAG